MKQSLIKNSFYNVLYKSLNVFFPLITASYISKVLLAKGVGEVSYAQNIVSYFITFAALGIPNYGTREIAKVQNNEGKRDSLFSDLFLINLISTTISFIGYLILINVLPMFQNNIIVYYAVGLSLMLNVINIDWFYQGTENYKYIANRSFLIKGLMLIMIFCFVRDTNDTVTYALIYSLGIGGNNVLNILNLRKYNIRLKLNCNNLKKHLKPIFILLASSIAIELYTMVDTTMLGILCNPENVGYYTNAMKLVKLFIGTITAIGGVLLPRLSLYYSQNKLKECTYLVNKVLNILLFIFLPALIGIFILSEQIILVLFGDSFIPGIVTLKIASLLIVTLGFSNLFGTQVLITFKSESKLFICTIVGATVNLLLNFILIPIYQQNGAAIASVISEACVTLITLKYAKEYIQIKFSKKILFITVISTIFMAITVIIVISIIKNPLIQLVLSISIGVIIYAISASILMKICCKKMPDIKEI